MKAFFAAALVAIALAVAASYVLDDRFQQSAQDAFATEGARLSN